MMRLVWFELIKTFTRWRTYIRFLAFGVIVPLVVIGLKLGGQLSFERRLLSLLQNDFVIGGNVLNGWFFGFFFMGALWVHVPILLTIVAGDQIAGEGNAGTFRFLLIHTVSRTRIITAKFIVTLIYTALMVFFIGGTTMDVFRVEPMESKSLIRHYTVWVGGNPRRITQVESLSTKGTKGRVKLTYRVVEQGLEKWPMPEKIHIHLTFPEGTNNADAAFFSTRDNPVSSGMRRLDDVSGEGDIDIAYSEWRINTGLDDRLFKKPTSSPPVVF